jgi:hypothetical protein
MIRIKMNKGKVNRRFFGKAKRKKGLLENRRFFNKAKENKEANKRRFLIRIKENKGRVNGEDSRIRIK